MVDADSAERFNNMFHENLMLHREQQPAYARESATTNSRRHDSQELRLAGLAQHCNDCQW